MAENESCGDVGLRRCDKVAVRRWQEVATTLLQCRHNNKHLVSRPFYYRQFWFLSRHRNVREWLKQLSWIKKFVKLPWGGHIFLTNLGKIDLTKIVMLTKKQGRLCVKLLKKTKKNFHNNLDVKKIVDNKFFLKRYNPIFLIKHWKMKELL